MSKSPSRHRSASIPVTPEGGNRILNSRTRHSNGGFLSLPSACPTIEGLPRSSPELPPQELHPHTMQPRNLDSQEQLSRRLSESMTLTESPSPRRRRANTSLSPHHSRSLSFRTMRRPTQQQVQDDFRPRVSTMPTDSKTYLRSRRRAYGYGRDTGGATGSTGLSLDFDLDEPVEDEYYLLRSFSITSKGVINHGDLMKQRSRSNTSVASTTSSLTGGGASSATSCSSGLQSIHGCRVLILGGVEVGKTSLAAQFTSSEYMNAYDGFQDDENSEKSVFVLLEGEEYELTIVDTDTCTEITMPDVESSDMDAYIVVYSVIDRSSFERAIDILFALREFGYTASRAVILVGNKSDLVRSRIVSTEEGKSIACTYECKFIETSAGINHNVDELLVGLVTQIRLKALQRKEMMEFSSPSRGRKRRSKGSLGSGHRARGIISKLLGREGYKCKSCDNLHVL